MEEATPLLREVPDWSLAEDGAKIERTYKVGDFVAALGFVNKIGTLAEAEWHHPEICFGWGHVAVSLRTKKIKGLHENDFIMAAKIDQLYATRI
jgi:4a-hydroxytetrahydrobiopterin dehydratase